MSDYNDKMIGFYAPVALVEEFNEICKTKHMNKSEWFRSQMEEFVAANRE